LLSRSPFLTRRSSDLDNLVDAFRFRAGQNITLRMHQGGEELRRSYSICSSPLENELRVAIKRQEEGKFSTHANRHLQPGDRIDVDRKSTRLNSSHVKI